MTDLQFAQCELPSVEILGRRCYRIHGIDRAVVGSRHLFFSSDVEMARDFVAGPLVLRQGEWISTGTLRNSLYLEPLSQLTRVRDLSLFVDFEGAATLRILCARAGKKPKVFREILLNARERAQQLIEIGAPAEHAENSRLYWTVEAQESEFQIHDASYVTQATPRTDCRLLVLLRTYQRTADVKGILQRFARAGNQDPFYDAVLDHIHFFLLDTTPGADTSYDEPWQHDLNLEIVVSANLGGGGNAAHMLKLVDEKFTDATAPPTELLILDDDLTISTESLVRYFMFCAYRSQELICSAPVLMKSRPTVVWEDGGFWGRLNFHEGGGFNKQRNLFPNLLKHGQQVDSFDGLDAFCPLNPCEYSTFIFFGLPTAAFQRMGYPASFFLRGDDIEYSLRAQELDIPLVTNPNITVWHEPSHSYGQEYMAILHGIIINFTHSSQPAEFYRRFFEERLYEHASIDDEVGINLYKSILSEIVNPDSSVLSHNFEKHYIEKLKEFSSVKMVRIQENERVSFEQQAKERNFLIVPFVHPGYQKDASKYDNVVVFNQATRSYRELPVIAPGEKTLVLKGYFELLHEFETRFGEVRQFWQQRLATTATKDYWTFIRNSHRADTRVVFIGQRAPDSAPLTESRSSGAPRKPTGSARNPRWLGRLRAAVEKGPRQTRGAISGGESASQQPDQLPDDFDPAVYLHINQDVVNSGIDPSDHYLRFGRREGRRYKLGR